jgi:hypothetical protein
VFAGATPVFAARTHRYGIGVALTLLVIYLLSYTGYWSSIDEMSALAVVETWAQQGALHTNQMDWEQFWRPSQNSVGADGNLYSKKGLGVSLTAAPLFLLGKALRQPGAVQTAKFTGALLSALTAYILFLAIAAALRTSVVEPERVALWATLAWGVGTLAWPYAKTVYSEPLAALGLALLLYGLLSWPSEHFASAPRPLRQALIAGSGLAIIVLAKTANGVVTLPAGLYLGYLCWRGRRPLLQQAVCLASFALPVALAVGVTMFYNWLRFGLLLTFPLDSIERFSTPLATGTVGLLLSSGKGLLWYTPLLWLAAPAWRFWLRPERRASALLLLGCIFLPLLLYAAWFDWPGGRAWGPRMIVWTLPAWLVWIAPVFTWLQAPGARWRRIGLLSLWAVSCTTQLPGVLVDVGHQEGVDLQGGVTLAEILWRLPQSPLLSYWRAIGSPTTDPLLAQGFVWTHSPWLAGSATVLGILGLLVGWGTLRTLPRRTNLLVLCLVCALLTFSLGALARNDPRWRDASTEASENAELAGLIDEQASAHDLVLFDQIRYFDIDSRAWWWMNRAKLQPAYIAWLRREQMREEDIARLQRWLRPYDRLWLLLVGTPEDDPASLTERTLDALAGRGRQTWIGTQRLVEYLLLPDQPAPLADGQGVRFGEEGVLSNYSVYASRLADGYVVRLDWRPTPPEHLRFSVQSLSREGQLVHQVDGRLGRNVVASGVYDLVGIEGDSDRCHIILKVYDAATGAVLEQAGQDRLELCTGVAP